MKPNRKTNALKSKMTNTTINDDKRLWADGGLGGGTDAWDSTHGLSPTQAM